MTQEAEVVVMSTLAENFQITDLALDFEPLRKLTHEQGSLLIYDEIVTGFRVALDIIRARDTPRRVAGLSLKPHDAPQRLPRRICSS